VLLVFTPTTGEASLVRPERALDLGERNVDPLVASLSGAQQQDLRELTLEELLNVEVISVSRQPERRFTAASAVHVLTSDDIARSGARDVADALRMVPGVQVAQINGNAVAVSARGFNSRFANKMLVMVDGRTIYTPLFSGVFWDTVDVPIDLIDRIEVILGPGGSAWGTNAVNGVINILTLPASETTGTRNELGAGTEERLFDSFRHGGALGDSGHYLVFGHYRKRDPGLTPAGERAVDGRWLGHGGFRVDWLSGRGHEWTVQGGAYGGVSRAELLSSTLTPPFSETLALEDEVTGGDLAARWKAALTPGSETSLSAYLNSYHRNERPVGSRPGVEERVHTVDVEGRHSFAPAAGHRVDLGGGFRVYDFDTTPDAFGFSLRDPAPVDTVANVFAQDHVHLIGGRVELTLGARLERSSLAGVELLPTARALWNRNSDMVVWGAVSRAARLPSRVDTSAVINAAVFPTPGGLAVLRLEGQEDIAPETLVAYEAGVRSRLRDDLALEASAFYNDHGDLISQIDGPPRIEEGLLVLPLVFDNLAESSSWGGEAVATLRPRGFLRVVLSYGYARVDLRPVAGRGLGADELDEDPTARHQVKLRTYLDLPHDLRLDTTAGYVDALPAIGIPPRTRLDVSFGWRPAGPFELKLVGQDLLSGSHVEFRELAGGQLETLLQRGVYASIVWRSGAAR
jgi:iron complex outermembrane receptor protein